MRFNRVISLTLMALCAAATLLVITKRDDWRYEPPQRYIEGLAGAPDYLNPILCQYNQLDRDLASLVFSGLTTVDAKGAIIPDLAQTWAVSGDSLVYTFTLRADILWHDGIPFSADDVVYTVSAIQDPDYRGVPYLAELWRDVRVTKIDTHTIQFHLTKPFAPFLSYTTIGILPAHLLAAVPAAELPEHAFNFAPVGTGSFVVREFDAAHILLTPFENYYREPPRLTELEFRFYPDNESVWAAYRRGEIAGVGVGAGLKSAPVTASQTEDGHVGAHGRAPLLQLYSAPRAGYGIIFLNLQRPLFAEKEVRQALLYALNRQVIIDLVLEKQGAVAHSPFMPASWAYNPAIKTYAHEPATAAALLDWSGWQDRDGDGVREDGAGNPFTFSLLTAEEATQRRVAEEVARQWAKVGIDAQVESVPTTAIAHEHLRPRQFAAVLGVWHKHQVDPDPYAQWHSSQVTDGGQNYAGFINRDADRIIEQARRVTNQDERAALYREFQDIFAEEVPALLLYYPIYTYAVDKRVQNIELGTLYDASDRFRTVREWIISP